MLLVFGAILAGSLQVQAQQYTYYYPTTGGGQTTYYYPQQTYTPQAAGYAPQYYRTPQAPQYYQAPTVQYYQAAEPAQATAGAQVVPTAYIVPTAETAQPAQAAPSGASDPYGFLGWLNSVRASYGLGAVGHDANLSGWASMNNNAQLSRGLGHHVMGPARRQNSAMGGVFPGAMWMASPAHRAALLDPTITWIGIAAAGAYWTFNAY
jgi:uncharacterized protein YkwD